MDNLNIRAVGGDDDNPDLTASRLLISMSGLEALLSNSTTSRGLSSWLRLIGLSPTS